MRRRAGDPGAEPQRPALPPALRSFLRCPLSGEELVDGVDDAGRPCLISPKRGLLYPVCDGVPVLLAHEAVRAPAPPG